MIVRRDVLRCMHCWPILSVVLFPLPANAQQRVDPEFNPRISAPAFAGNGPTVTIDAAHGNFHVLEGRFEPFGRLASADGFKVVSNSAKFDTSTLPASGILVIANARAPNGLSAFTEPEIKSVRAWVENGGSLLFIADHAPFGTSASRLAEALGVSMGLGYVVSAATGPPRSQIRFTGSQIADHAISGGRTRSERVKAVTSFTGQSLTGPAGSTAILRLPSDALEVENSDDADMLARGQKVPARSVGNRAQVVAFELGKGRVVVAGEAAMFTEQSMSNGRRTRQVGLSVDDDKQFTLNVLHWLARII